MKTEENLLKSTGNFFRQGLCSMIGWSQKALGQYWYYLGQADIAKSNMEMGKG